MATYMAKHWQRRWQDALWRGCSKILAPWPKKPRRRWDRGQARMKWPLMLWRPGMPRGDGCNPGEYLWHFVNYASSMLHITGCPRVKTNQRCHFLTGAFHWPSQFQRCHRFNSTPKFWKYNSWFQLTSLVWDGWLRRQVNVFHTMNFLLRFSESIREMVKTGQVQIQGGATSATWLSRLWPLLAHLARQGQNLGVRNSENLDSGLSLADGGRRV